MAIPLFEEVAGVDYFEAAYSSNNPASSAEQITRNEDRYGRALRQGDLGVIASRRMREYANNFTMMLGMFHILSHKAREANESFAGHILEEYADGYNFLFDYYDPSVLISALTTKSYYSNQRSTPVSFMPNSGFIADSPTVLDGGNTSIFSDGGQYKPRSGAVTEIEISHLTSPDDTGTVPNIYLSLIHI